MIKVGYILPDNRDKKTAEDINFFLSDKTFEWILIKDFGDFLIKKDLDFLVFTSVFNNNLPKFWGQSWIAQTLNARDLFWKKELRADLIFYKACQRSLISGTHKSLGNNSVIILETSLKSFIFGAASASLGFKKIYFLESNSEDITKTKILMLKKRFLGTDFLSISFDEILKKEIHADILINCGVISEEFLQILSYFNYLNSRATVFDFFNKASESDLLKSAHEVNLKIVGLDLFHAQWLMCLKESIKNSI